MIHSKCLAILQGHTSLVGQLQLRGDTLVTGGSDGSVRVWSLKTYTPIHRLAAHDNSVTSLQFDESRIVSGGSDGRVKVWDLARGQLVRELGQPAEAVWRVVFEDEKAVVLASRGGKTVMEVWSFAPPEDPMDARRYGGPASSSSAAASLLLAADRSATASPTLSDIPFSEPASSPLPMREDEHPPLGPSGLRGEVGEVDAEHFAHYYDDAGRVEPVASHTSSTEVGDDDDELDARMTAADDVVMTEDEADRPEENEPRSELSVSMDDAPDGQDGDDHDHMVESPRLRPEGSSSLA